MFKIDIDGQRIVEGGDYPTEDKERDELQKVNLTPQGREWLGAGMEEELRGHSVIANTFIPDNVSVNKLILLSTQIGPYVTGYNLNGWGWLFRVEGEPDEDVVLKVVPEVAEYLYFNPPTLLPFKGVGYRECLLEYK